MLEKIIGGLAIFLGFVVLILIIGLLVSWPFMLLWNGCLVAALPSVVAPLTSIWQAWGILILSAFLFKGTSVSSK